jgi:hypothetical protein
MDAIDEADVMSLFTAENIIGTEYGMEVNDFYLSAPKEAEDLEKIKMMSVPTTWCLAVWFRRMRRLHWW